MKKPQLAIGIDEPVDAEMERELARAVLGRRREPLAEHEMLAEAVDCLVENLRGGAGVVRQSFRDRIDRHLPMHVGAQMERRDRFPGLVDTRRRKGELTGLEAGDYREVVLVPRCAEAREEFLDRKRLLVQR